LFGLKTAQGHGIAAFEIDEYQSSANASGSVSHAAAFKLELWRGEVIMPASSCSRCLIPS
jgi:hypothetical protein